MTNFKVIDGSTTVNFDNLIKVEGFEFPSINTVYTDTPGRSGAFFVKSKYGRRRLSWQGYLTSLCEVDRRAILGFNIGELKTLKFETGYGLALQTNIELESILMPYQKLRTPYLFEAISPDYRFYSQTLSSADTAPTTATGGVTLPTALPIDFSNVVGVSDLTIVNAGNAYSPPTMIITGPGTNFTIQNVTTGESLIISTTITATDTITIDVLNKTILLNGTTNIFGLSNREFWEVPPGSSDVHFVAETGEGPSTSLNFSFRSAYKGI